MLGHVECLPVILIADSLALRLPLLAQMRSADPGGRLAVATEQRALLVDSGSSRSEEGITWVQLQPATG
jgi:hypothetical protein